MVRRRVPLGRRIRAHLGTLVNTGLWCAATATCVVLYLLQAPTGGTLAVAVVKRHPVVVPEGGRMATLQVEVGAVVEVGQELATIEVPGLAEQVRAAQAELAALESTLLGDAESTRRFAKDTSGAQARWLAARVALESQRAQLIAKEMELARLQLPGTAVAVLQVEQARASRDALLVEIEARAEELTALAATYADARERAGAGADPALEAQVQAAGARVGALQQRLDAGTLRAPAAGVVAAIPEVQDGAATEGGHLPSPGTWLPGGVPVLLVVEASAEEAVVYLPPARALALADGAAVTLSGADGRSISARVVSVAASVEAVPLRQLSDPSLPEWGVPVRLRAAGEALKPGEAFAITY